MNKEETDKLFKKTGKRVIGTMFIFLGVIGFFVITPKEGWEIANRASLILNIIIGIYLWL